MRRCRCGCRRTGWGCCLNSPLTVDSLPSSLRVYPEWNPSVHLINPFEIPDEWARWWGCRFWV